MSALSGFLFFPFISFGTPANGMVPPHLGRVFPTNLMNLLDTPQMCFH
jgi:hypothetical protein